MRRFIITALIATVLHAVACIIAPPFEFDEQSVSFRICFWRARFPRLCLRWLLPLRWGCPLMSQGMQRAQAIVAGSVLLGLAAAWGFTHPTFPFQHGLYVHWLFWLGCHDFIFLAFWRARERRLTIPPQSRGSLRRDG